MERLRAVAKEDQELKGVDPQTSDQAVSRLIAVAGNLPVDQCNRQHAKDFLDPVCARSAGLSTVRWVNQDREDRAQPKSVV